MKSKTISAWTALTSIRMCRCSWVPSGMSRKELTKTLWRYRKAHCSCLETVLICEWKIRSSENHVSFPAGRMRLMSRMQSTGWLRVCNHSLSNGFSSFSYFDVLCSLLLYCQWIDQPCFLLRIKSRRHIKLCLQKVSEIQYLNSFQNSKV